MGHYHRKRQDTGDKWQMCVVIGTRPHVETQSLKGRDRIETDQKEQIFMIYLRLTSPKYRI